MAAPIGNKNNPTGKGGFKDNPQNISSGSWNKENTISYQYNRFMNMTPDELTAWAQTPQSEKTVAMDLAYRRVVAAQKSLPDVKEITDRTEGKAPQSIDLTTKGDKLDNTPNKELADEFAAFLKAKTKSKR